MRTVSDSLFTAYTHNVTGMTWHSQGPDFWLIPVFTTQYFRTDNISLKSAFHWL